MQWLMKNVGVSGAHGFPFSSITHGAEGSGDGRKDRVPIALFFPFSVIRKLGTRIMLIMSKK